MNIEEPFTGLDADIHYSGKWNTRGWTFQEMAMSTRVLAFGDAGIHFLGIDKLHTLGHQPIPGPHNSSIYLLRGAGELCYMHWFGAVATPYSKRSLTYPHDRFPALSGIARYFSEELKDEYVAGLWKRELHRSLFWACSENSIQTLGVLIDELSDLSKYVAPSWSWACRQDSVGYTHLRFSGYSPIFEGYREEYRSMETDITYKGADRFGQIKEASLQIVAKTCPLPSDIHIEDSLFTDAYIGYPKAPFARCQVP